MVFEKKKKKYALNATEKEKIRKKMYNNFICNWVWSLISLFSSKHHKLTEPHTSTMPKLKIDDFLCYFRLTGLGNYVHSAILQFVENYNFSLILFLGHKNFETVLRHTSLCLKTGNCICFLYLNINVILFFID